MGEQEKARPSLDLPFPGRAPWPPPSLARPTKLNAIDISMRREISACLASWNDDPAVRAVIFTGQGRAFSAGFDLATLCDLRIGAEEAWFSHPEIAHGAPPLFSPLRWA